MGTRCIVQGLCVLGLAYLSMGQNTGLTDITYPDKNLTFAGVEINFRAEPKGRGTMGIMLSCVATFLFCIWGTVHPDIIVGAKAYYRLFYKGVLMLAAIVVPEGLILCAFSQYREAKDLHNRWLEKYGEGPDSEKEPWYTSLRFWEDSKSTFGMETAFFVVMGGFVVKTGNPTGGLDTEELQNVAINTQGQHTREERDSLVTGQRNRIRHIILTPEGFKYYLKDFIHKDTMQFHRQAVLDKGKSSNMAKLLAGLQALWLIVQCFARVQAGLPVTLLEIHVAIQVVCTMIIFFCWWSKPLDVNNHIEITLKVDKGRLGEKDIELQRELNVELENLESEEDKIIRNRESKVAVNPKGQRFILKETPPDLTGITAKAFYDICNCLSPYRSEVTTQSSTRAHWKAMGAEALLVFLTGALHAAAWNYPFAAESGRILWRASTIGMCIFPTLAVFIASITAYQEDLSTAVWEIHLRRGEEKRHLWGMMKATSDQLVRMAQRHGRKISESGAPERKGLWGCFITCLHYLLMWVVLLLLVAYAVSIITITIISFVNMRSLPVGAFNTPRWNDYWPHF